MSPRTWLPDPSHYPEQLTPLSATVWFEAIGYGIHEAMRELRGPFGGFVARTELGWAYEGELEPEWEPVEGALRAAGLRLPERWERELKPRARALTEEVQALRPERASAAEVADVFDRMWALVLEQWVVHFLAVIPAQAAIETAFDALAEQQGRDDPLAPYRLLQGRDETTEADAMLRRLAGRALDLDVADVVAQYPVDTALERLGEFANGRAWLRELDGYLSRYGGRARLHELSLPREVERPEMTLESLRLFIESGDAPVPEPVPPVEIADPSGRLAEILPAARFGYDLKESHVYHIDYPGLLATREVLLGFGRRLLAEGVLRSPGDLWMIRRSELRDALTTDGPVDLAELADERRAELAAGRGQGPKPYLGDAPDERPREAIVEKFYGRGQTGVERGILRGDGASPGTAVGPARVVAGPEDFRRVRPGDVLVATTTTPAWTPLFGSIAALVTETGGILSHAAIVAREYRLPAVVGASDATKLLRDGEAVRVDGGAGTVTTLTGAGSGDTQGHEVTVSKRKQGGDVPIV
jgi:phosphohistidine swiveling domain-containing protein